MMADSTSTIDAAGSTDRAELGMDRSKNLSSCRDVTVGLVTDVSEGHERRKVGKYVSEHTPGRAVTVVAAAAEAQRGWRRAREGRCERGRGDHARCVRGNCKRWKAGVDAGLLETRRVEGRDGRAWGGTPFVAALFLLLVDRAVEEHEGVDEALPLEAIVPVDCEEEEDACKASKE